MLGFHPDFARTSQHKYKMGPYPYRHLPRLIFVSEVTSCGRPCKGPQFYTHESEAYELGTTSVPYEMTYYIEPDIGHAESFTYNCPQPSGATLPKRPVAQVEFRCWDGTLIKVHEHEICGSPCLDYDVEQMWSYTGLTPRLDVNTT